MTPDPSPRPPPSEHDPHALAVPPARVRDPGGGRRAAELTLGGVAAVLALAIGVAVFLPGGTPTGPTGPPVAVAASPSGEAPAAPTPEPTPTLAPEATLPPAVARYNAHELAEQVAAGSLDGRLVLVIGNLEVIPLTCDTPPDALHTCVLLAIEGVDIPVDAGPVTVPWHDNPPQGDLLVVMPSHGKLVYLGHLPPVSRAPRLIDGLTRDLLRAQPAGVPSSMFLVDGWLIPEPPSSCPVTTDPSASPCWMPGPFLADDAPAADGTPRSRRGTNVLIGDAIAPIPGINVVDGPFLVTMLTGEQCATDYFAHVCAGAGGRWVVEARYRDVVLAEEPRAGAAAGTTVEVVTPAP